MIRLSECQNGNSLRRCRFQTADHRYGLILWDTGRLEQYGKSVLGYRLNQDGKTLFFGEDFSPGAGICTDSDEALASLMNFLVLKPGDVEREYFAGYTPEQMEFAQGDAEYLSHVVAVRFGEV
jgi:hypothetical protein